MSEKRFIIDAMNPLHIHDNGTGEVITARSRMCDLLNELSDENEQLQIQLKNTSAQRDEFHRGASENAKEIGKLRRENEWLQQTVQYWQGKYEQGTETLNAKLLEEEIGARENDILKLREMNEQLRQNWLKSSLFYNCDLKTIDDLKHLRYIFEICKMLIDDAVEENDVELAIEGIRQFESRMRHFNQDKSGEKRIMY